MLRGVVTAAITAVLLFGLQPVWAGQLLVVSKAEQKLAFYDADTGKLLGSVDTGADPREVVVSPDKRRAFVSDFGSHKNTVSAFDIAGRSLVKRHEIPGIFGPHGMAMTSDGKSLYVTFEKSRAVGRIDPDSGKLLQTINTGMKLTHYLALSSDNKWLFAANLSDDNVTWIDTATGTVNRHIYAGDYPEGLAVSPDHTELWVGAQGTNVINIIDLVGTKKIVANIPCQGSPARVKFTPDGKRVLVTCATMDQMFVFDVETRTTVKRLTTGSTPYGIAITPDGRLAYIAIAGDSMVVVLDLETLEFVREFATLQTPAGIAYVD